MSVEAAVSASAGNRIDRFLAILPTRGGSDLHLSVGCPPLVRIDGELERLRYRTLTEGDFYNLLAPVTPGPLWEAFLESGDVDFAYQMGDQARFRVNLFRQERGSAAVLRLIPSRIPTAEDLNLPAAVAALYAMEKYLRDTNAQVAERIRELRAEIQREMGVMSSAIGHLAGPVALWASRLEAWRFPNGRRMEPQTFVDRHNWPDGAPAEA